MENDKIRLYAEHLSGMVKYPTLSNVDEDKVNYQAFYDFHKYLEETYPLIHKTMEKKVIGKASLLYKWPAKNPAPGKKPVLLIAHQDVVPENDHSLWKYPPYSGLIDGTFVWGRGSGDCKSTILCEMEAVEALIASGFEADYDIYLGFGHNEEIQVPHDRKGACLIADYLQEQGVTLGAVFDEGGGPAKMTTDTFDGYNVTLFMAEKGFVDFEIYCDTNGGHSMAPGQGTGLGKVAQAVVAIEANPMPYRLTPLTESSLKASAKLYSGKTAEIYADPAGHFEELCQMAKEDKFLDAKLHSTFAVTMAQGSGQSNVLPMHAAVIMNVRSLQGDTIESIEEYIRKLLPEGVEVRALNGNNPTPAVEAKGHVFDLIGKIERDRLDGELVIVPNLLPGGTDARNYTGICDSVFRYTGTIPTGHQGPAHGIDEFYDCASAPSSIQFYTEFLKQY
ncbi:MAG: M20/M25/M40 family metallo-hydrolase [Firmicutes bacterium]|nr:M20/M25/M40 family metallo-hydrolase [Bacillota bacterium]